ncbi:orotidine 5'-phosphate decarboxylase [Virgibacillus sp. C22-A2]|uniref:3-hexulose-6-phosphate synthase n=1 Tax=Virgibacillus tibetensis TaxID=3042313 RepID=A0ABU6KHA1_9BACI|nr:orotidine 5'-phosphate decarboxylase [Virgibacillus sp. C22-A2]
MVKKIQLALDRMTKKECIYYIDETKDFIDYIEIGTGVIKEYGMNIVKEIRETYPSIKIIADMKTCDAGKSETEQAINSGANISTVMGFSNINTIKETLDAANTLGGEMLIDLLGISSKEQVTSIYDIGARKFCMHIGKDMQSKGEQLFTSMFDLVDDLTDVTVFAAGGINEVNIKNLKGLPIDTFIVGSGIASADNPRKAAENIKKIVSEF